MHVAVIIDGNGRWGLKHLGVRTKGHEEGARNVWRLVQNLPGEIKYLTLYGLSIDNIKERPRKEVDKLYQIFQENFAGGLEDMLSRNIHLNYIGDGGLPAPLLAQIWKACCSTQHNSGLVLSIALSYGSRSEIVRAATKLQAWNEPITEHSLEAALDTHDLPNVDLLIRTGGEKRLSDFLLWQVAYAELFFTDTLWPDFGLEELVQILDRYHKRERRFGGLGIADK